MIKKTRERMIGDKTQIRMTVTPNMKLRLTTSYKTKNYLKNPKLKNNKNPKLKNNKNPKLKNNNNPTKYKVLRIENNKILEFPKLIK